MSWIKDNKFLVTLTGVTVVVAGLLLFLGLNASSRYDEAKELFDTAAQEASGFEQISLYPRPENRHGKSKALEEYRKAVTAIQESFAPFRPEKIENVSPQVFTTRLKEVNDEVLKAFKDAGTKVPNGFFSGFENYKDKLAPGSATGILGHQLDGVRNILLALAGSGASELSNLHRPLLAEEQGGTHEAQPAEVARPLPLEITMRGSEKSVREFLSAITKPDKKYVVIRSLRISNTKQIAPKTADAKFLAPPPVKEDTPRFDDIFGAATKQTGDDAAKTDSGVQPAAAPAPVAVDTSLILMQVLGNEELIVFLRLDLLQFLPVQTLP